MGSTLRIRRRSNRKHFNGARLIERKLGRERNRKGKSKYAFGQHSSDGLIEVDPRQGECTRLDSIIHELLHHVNEDWSEAKVEEAAGVFTEVLWKDGWRRVRL